MPTSQPTTRRGLPGIPSWEAMKGSLRSISHTAAVAECARLSEQYFRMKAMSTVVELRQILRTLTAKKIPFVLTGTHGISAWMGKMRATQDVDLLVKSGRNLTRAIKALRALYPELEVRQHFGVTSFYKPGERLALIDVTYPHRADIEETLATAIWVEEAGERYRVPRLEAALANKYGAMLTSSRLASKRAQDAVDFLLMVEHSSDPGQQSIDLEVLAALGEKVWPGGGGAEIVRFVENAKVGKVPHPSAIEPRV